jgi:hypothetical protein
MSCPDWSALAARRNDAHDANAARDANGAGEAAAAWQQALRHLDACASCRRQALAADPLLIFRRLPALEMGPEHERAEIEATRQAVAVMRTAALALQARPPFTRRLPINWRGLRPVHSRLAYAAGLALVALAVGSNHAWREDLRPRTVNTARPQRPQPGLSTTIPGAAAPGVPAATPASWRSPIERLNRPKARVYQYDGDHMSVVMIVDEKLDV